MIFHFIMQKYNKMLKKLNLFYLFFSIVSKLAYCNSKGVYNQYFKKLYLMLIIKKYHNFY